MTSLRWHFNDTHYLCHHQAADMLLTILSWVPLSILMQIRRKFRLFSTQILSNWSLQSLGITQQIYCRRMSKILHQSYLQKSNYSETKSLSILNYGRRFGTKMNLMSDSWCNERGMGAGITLARECLPVRSSVMELKPWLRAQGTLLLSLLVLPKYRDFAIFNCSDIWQASPRPKLPSHEPNFKTMTLFSQCENSSCCIMNTDQVW